ncbi:MAG: DUF1343 domain-containing protein [Deltaproteobacteria bacterium]|nr:DUF1343 domain-containing protein [bacterium]MCB9487925.1 DUF1343 domain-containing protein [Deltaproteobacteria bacterium]
MPVKLGIENFMERPREYIGKRRVGLLINQTSYSPSMVGLLDYCLRSEQVACGAVFAPEHGLYGARQDMEQVDETKLPDGTPVYSLYGTKPGSLTPDGEMLADLDAVIFDIQDVGSRYYTFIWSMALCMKACAEHGKAMVVLDRPNPLGGSVVSGTVQTQNFLSFVGMHPVPVRHGMTAGEMARLLKGHFHYDCELIVVPMDNWHRDMWFDQTQLPWIPPSPNMPHSSTAAVYPGGCLLEGTNISEGRGTTTPFELVGAPWIVAEDLATALNDLKLPGVAFRPSYFVPKFQKYADQQCGGVFVHLRDRDVADTFEAYCHLIGTVKAMYPDQFAWRDQPYEFVKDIPAIDLLFGSDGLRKGVDAGKPVGEILEPTRRDAVLFDGMRQEYLLYRLSEGGRPAAHMW